MMSRQSAPLELNENTPLPMRLVAGVVALAVAGATALALLQSQVESVKSEIGATNNVVAEIRADRKEMLKAWKQDQIDNAHFQSVVLTKLERIERAVK